MKINVYNKREVINLIDKNTRNFYKLLNINIYKKPFYTAKIIDDEVTLCQEQKSLYKGVYSLKKKKKENLWFAVNEFTTVDKTVFVNERHAENYIKELREICFVKKFNAVYCDIDFKDINGNHFDTDTVQNMKKTLLKKIKDEMPLLVSAIVESRNGLHLYLALEEQSRNISLEGWKELEERFFCYVRDNISSCVDKKAKLVTQILRVPLSIHQKADSEPFEIKVISLHKKRYTIEELKQAFPEIDTTVHKKGRKKTDINKSYDNRLSDAIKNLDVNYFDYVTKYNLKLSYKDACEFVRQYDLRTFFNLDIEIHESFSSVFRKDNNPSCSIYYDKRNNRYFYHDFGLELHTDLAGIIQQYADVDFKTALYFLCDVFNIKVNEAEKIHKDINLITESNKDIFSRVAENKKIKFMRKVSKVYDTILKVWNERNEQHEFNNPLDIDLSLSAEFLSNQADVKPSQASRILLILEGINALQKIESDYKGKFNEKVNTYHIVELNQAELETKALHLKEVVKNPFHDMTRGKLELLSA